MLVGGYIVRSEIRVAAALSIIVETKEKVSTLF